MARPINRSLKYAAVVLAFGRLAPGLVHAAPVEPEAIRCAFVSASDEAAVAILEANLLQRESEVWLERNQVDRILAERELQTAFGASSGADRVALGKLLRADLLVLLRTGVENDQRFADLVVAETAHGLRLLNRKIILTDDPESESRALERQVEYGLDKHRQAIRAIYAVPPFVSRDLSNEFDHLKAAYARIIEQTLLALPGVVVVELDEADAIKREYELVAPEQRPERPMPQYVLGEYRHERADDGLQVSVSIEVRDSGQQVFERSGTVLPEASAVFVQRTAAGLLQAEALPPDAGLEARELASRAATFLTLGDWAEAMALYEAALLLDSKQPELRLEVIRSAMELAQLKGKDRGDYAEVVSLNQRALDHTWMIFRAGQPETLMEASKLIFRNHLLRSGTSFDILRTSPAVSDEAFRRVESLLRDQARLAEAFRQRQVTDEVWRSLYPPYVDVWDTLPGDRYAAASDLILKHQQELSTEMKLSIFGGWDNSIERREFLKGLLASPNLGPPIRTIAEGKLRSMDQHADWLAPRQGESTESPPPVDDSNEQPRDISQLTVMPLMLSYIEDGRERRVVNPHCIPLPDGTDIFLGDNGTPVVKVTDPNSDPQVIHPGSHSPKTSRYDGQYIWMVATGTIVILDPLTGESWDIGSSDGIPSFARESAPRDLRPSAQLVAPVRQGEAIVAGGLEGTWLAKVTLGRDGNHQVDVFHEATEVIPTGTEPAPRRNADKADPNAIWRNPHIRYKPERMCVLHPPGEPVAEKQFVVVWRDVGRFLEFQQHPLLVDPGTLQVEVVQQEIPFFRRSTVWDGSCYFRDYDFATNSRFPARIAPPDFKTEVVAKEPNGERYAVWNGELQIVGNEWWNLDLETKRANCLGRVPWYFPTPETRGRAAEFQLASIGYSQHFGWFANVRPPEGFVLPFRVVFDGSGMTLREAVDLQSRPRRSSEPSTSRMPVDTPPRVENLWYSEGRRYYTDLAFSPDGRLIITTCAKGAVVQAWDAATGELIADLLEHSQSMKTVVFDRSGKYFATSGADGSMFLWSADDLRSKRHAKGTSSRVPGETTLAFSRDSRWLAACVRGNEVVVWNTDSGTERTRVTGGSQLPRSGEFTPDGQCLISFDGTKGTQLWRLDSGRSAGVIETIYRPLGILPSGELLGLASNLDRSLVAWDCQTNTHRVLWKRTPRNPVTASPDGRFLLDISGAYPRDGAPACPQLTVWEIATQRELAVLHTAFFARQPKFSPSGDLLAGVRMNGLLWKWDLTQSAAREQPRTWSDASGQYRVEAYFDGLTRNGARLKRLDGQCVTVPLNRLSREDWNFLGKIPTSELAVSEPETVSTASVETDDDLIDGFGKPIDPDGDCRFVHDRWMLTLAIPGSPHHLRAESAEMNAPRVVQRVESDFRIEVGLEGDFSPSTPAEAGRPAYHGAGILVMLDERTYLRLERAAVRHDPRGDVQPLINFEFRRDGAVAPSADLKFWLYDNDVTGLALERNGGTFTPFIKGARTPWTPFRAVRLLLPAELTVGLTAVNDSTDPFEAKFKHLSILKEK